MAESPAPNAWAKLRALLVNSYSEFAEKLTRRLGSEDLAKEALHEAFLRIERGGDLQEVRDPGPYLYRMAVNIAHDQRSANARLRAAADEGEALSTLPDPAPDPEAHAAARQEILALQRVLLKMPRRRREIFMAAWIDGVPRRELAERFGVTTRTIQLELKHALEQCAEHSARNARSDFTSRPPKASKE